MLHLEFWNFGDKVTRLHWVSPNQKLGRLCITKRHVDWEAAPVSRFPGATCTTGNNSNNIHPSLPVNRRGATRNWVRCRLACWRYGSNKFKTSLEFCKQIACGQEPAYFMDRPEMVINRFAAEKVISQLQAGLEMETNFRLDEDDEVPRLLTSSVFASFDVWWCLGHLTPP